MSSEGAVNMKRLLASTILLAGVFLALICLTDPRGMLRRLLRGTSEPRECFAQANDFARQVAGVYFATVALPDFPPFDILVTVHQDGTYQVTGSDDYGFGNPEQSGFSFSCPEPGVWDPLGGNQVAGGSRIFIYGSNGQVISIQRVRVTATLSRLENGAFQDVSADFNQDIFNPDQDPIMDPPANLNTFQGTLTGKRLNVR
jgi:hypothetical protein